MYIFSNNYLEKILISGVKLFYKIDYKHTIFVRKIHMYLFSIIQDIHKILLYATTNMFNEIAVETTTYCNRKCVYCPNSILDRGAEANEKLISTEVFKKIIAGLKDLNFKGTIFPQSYGEPLLDTRLVDLMAYVHKNLPQAKICIHSNGDFLDIEMLNKLYDVGVKSYVITIHGNLKEGEERIRKIVDYINKSKKKIRIFCQVMNENTPLFTRSGLVKVKNINYNQPCLYPLTVNYKGDVLLCCQDYLGENVFGNLGEEKLRDIWNKANFSRIRKQLRRKMYTLEMCKRCANIN